MDDKAKQARQRGLFQHLPLYVLEYLIALAVTVTILYGGYYYCDCIPVPRSNDFSEKLLYAGRYCTFPQAVFLFIAVLRVGAKRGSANALNPLAGKEHVLQTEKNVLTNTAEQLHIFLFLVVTLTTYLEPSEMRIIPLYSLAFIVGRVLFMIGYGISPKYRSVGMGINFILTFFFIGYTIYLMYLRGFMYGTRLTANPTATTGTAKSEL
ncbi:MAG: MAPEG family protein [Proteobacteria bacterium]|nr:MAPEG family protein [Pseudomonadota bacterium]